MNIQYTEVIVLDLRHGEISLGELLENPKAKAVLQKRFGALLSHPMVGSAKKLSLQQIIQMAGTKIPKETINATISELKSI